MKTTRAHATLALFLLPLGTLRAQSQGGVTHFCSGGVGSATISASGSTRFDANGGSGELVLHAQGLPSASSGLFFYGDLRQPRVPFGNGSLCVAGTPQLWRTAVVSTPVGGSSVSSALDYLLPPAAAAAITPGSSWNFQYWFRDGAGFDLSDAMRIDFVPAAPVSLVSVLEDRARSGHPLGQLPEGGLVLINTQAELESFWALHTAPFTPGLPLPAVDMTQATLIAVFAGQRFSLGYDIEFTAVELSVTSLRLTSLEQRPGAGCGTIPSETNPMQLVAIRKVDAAQLGEWIAEVEVYTCP